jgi:hypothetical protein
MAEIKVYYPRDGMAVHAPIVAATGKYKRPERIRGLLSSMNDETSYSGTLHVKANKMWALFFGPVQSNHYRMHIFDFQEPSIYVDLDIRILEAAGVPRTRIIFPAAGQPLFDRNVTVIGSTTTSEISLVTIMHAGEADLLPAESLPIIPTGTAWSASFMIPSEYPCPGNSPDYTVHAEDALGAPHCDNHDVTLDASLCPTVMLKAAKKAKSEKKKAKKKKKKAKKK